MSLPSRLLAVAALSLAAGLAPVLRRVRIVAAPRLPRALVAQPPRVYAPRMQGFEFDFAQDEDEDDEDEAMAIAGDNPVLKIDANASVAELKEQLKTFGLRTTGSRPQLLERLEQIQRKIKKGLPVSEQEVLPSNELRWYMVQTANGFERAVERTIGQVIDAQNMQDDIEKVHARSGQARAARVSTTSRWSCSTSASTPSKVRWSRSRRVNRTRASSS